MLRFIVGLGILILSIRQPAAELKIDVNNVQENKEDRRIDTGAAFDQFATRFGAFAVVAAISYPLVRSSMAVQSAFAYGLPTIERNYATFIMMLVFSGLMILATIIIGCSTFMPILSWFERKVSAARLLAAFILGIILAGIIFLYITVMAMVVISSELSPALDDVSDILQHLSVCKANRLNGTICENALTICHEASKYRACQEEVKKYVDTLYPRTGVLFMSSPYQDR